MTILSQIREEASVIADSRAVEIFRLAEASLTQNRFELLRKHKAYPVTQRELDYVKALNLYVYYKIQVHRTDKHEYRYSEWDNRARFRKEMERHRELMDRIEYGLTPDIPLDIHLEDGESVAYFSLHKIYASRADELGN